MFAKVTFAKTYHFVRMAFGFYPDCFLAHFVQMCFCDAETLYDVNSPYCGISLQNFGVDDNKNALNWNHSFDVTQHLYSKLMPIKYYVLVSI